MEIIIEIGTDEQKELIRKELEFFEEVSKQCDLPYELKQVIVTADFDQKVNELLGSNNYLSIRTGHQAQAKTLYFSDSITIVFSPSIFTENWDSQCRLFFYIHELFHVLTSDKYENLKYDEYSKQIYSANLWILFDEYYANRSALKVTDELFPEKSSRFNNLINYCFEGYLSLLLSDKNITHLRREITSFKHHGNVNSFLSNIKETFDEVSKNIVYLFAYIDDCAEFKLREKEMYQSHFVNQHTIDLIDFFRDHYQRADFDLSKGMPLIENFMTVFGFILTETPRGPWCKVLDI